MSYDPNTTHGYAQQKMFWEMPISDIPALTGEEESTNVAGVGENRRFAHLVYQVNSPPITISGDVDIQVDTDNLEIINANGFGTLTGQVLDVCNKLTSGVVDPPLSLFVEASGDFTWIAEGFPGSVLVSADWRIKQVEDVTVDGFQIIRILWADGNGNFDNVASSPLSGLSYS